MDELFLISVAARMLGMRDAVSNRPSAVVANTDVLALGAALEARLQATLGPEEWAQALESGGGMSIDELLVELGSA